MKIKNKLLFGVLLFFLSISFFLPLIRAENPMDQPVNFTGFGAWLGGIFGMEFPGTTWQIFITFLIVLAIFLFAFHDIFYDFTMFSPLTCWIIAAGLAIIGSLTRGTLAVAKVLLVISAWAGTFAIAIAIITAFAVFAILHLGLGGIGNWLRRRREGMQREGAAANIRRGVAVIDAAGDEAHAGHGGHGRH